MCEVMLVVVCFLGLEAPCNKRKEYFSNQKKLVSSNALCMHRTKLFDSLHVRSHSSSHINYNSLYM